MIIVLLKNEFNDTIFNVNFCLKDLKCYLLKFKCHFFDKKIILTFRYKNKNNIYFTKT